MTTKSVKVQIPSIPNFIKVGNEWMPLSFFSEDELRAIGAEFTKDMIARGKRKKERLHQDFTKDSAGDFY